MSIARFILAAGAALAPACGGGNDASTDASTGDDAANVDDAANGDDAAAASVNCDAFVITGDPTAMRGATWTYESTDDGVAYRLSGALLAPAGAGPFPSVVVSHGYMGSAGDFGVRAGATFRDAGLLVIATNYTHGSVTGLLPDGPGDDFGSSTANIQRAYKARQLLSCIAAADTSHVAAHGHSMGAFLTGGLLGTHPDAFIVASITAGGVADAPTGMTIAATPSALARQITTPLQLHHGTNDCTVSLTLGERLDGILAETGTVHMLYTYDYPNVCTCPAPPSECDDHRLVSEDTVVWDRILAWYETHGLL